MIPDIPRNIFEIANKYEVSVVRDTYNCDHNEGSCACGEISLGSFDESGVELIAFFHELGHAMSNKLVCKRGRTMTTLSGEGLAWELGLGLAYDCGYEWEYNSIEMQWAREQYATYKHI